MSSPLLPLQKGTGAFLVVSLEERLLFPLPLQLSQAKTYNTKPRTAPLDKRRLRKTSPLSDREPGREDGSVGKLLALQGLRSEFETQNPCSKPKGSGMVAHTCNTSAGETETGRPLELTELCILGK